MTQTLIQIRDELYTLREQIERNDSHQFHTLTLDSMTLNSILIRLVNELIRKDAASQEVEI